MSSLLGKDDIYQLCLGCLFSHYGSEFLHIVWELRYSPSFICNEIGFLVCSVGKLI